MNNDLAQRFKLDRSVGEHPVFNVDDLYIVIHHLWTKDTTPYPDGRQIIQLAFLLLVSAYTASRPGALVYVEKNERTNAEHFFGSVDDVDAIEKDTMDEWDLRDEDLKTLCYGQISLVLLPNPGGIRDHLVMEVDLRHTKGHNKKKKSKIFLMSEVKQPFFDIVGLVVAMAFLDEAFESNIRSVEDIYATRVKSPRRSLNFKFVKEKLNVPICRQPESTSCGVSTHDVKPLRYHTYLYYLQLLSLAVGKPRAMKPYETRRGAGEAVEKTAPLPLLQQVMGHVYASTFQTYMNQRVQCHVQAAFLGIPSEDALMNILSHQSRYIDPRAPSHYEDLSATTQATLSTHPEIITLQEMRDTLTREAKEMYGSLKNAAGSKIGELKVKTEAALREFFATIDTLEINSQLDPSLLDIDKQAYEPEKIVHRLKERRRVAELMEISMHDLSEEDDMAQRVYLVNALIGLGRVVKVPSERAKPEKQAECATNNDQNSFPKEPYRAEYRAETEPSSSPEPRDCPISLTNRHCLFCIFKPEYQCYFASPRKAREHFEKHLRKYKRTEPILCPDEFCQLVLNGHKALKRHAEKIHHVRYFTDAQRIQAGF
ncbi:hypothetical protein N7460_000323 [Penicillium canescens]|uniref:C2H2-type domain-containing protein n=1 Tax=Penicillium canescens TaxID=5083 RepID=A0AAD6IMI0_PENCN|nr:hypothetical protein N7460_000323 [Penicillium canescens]